MPSTVIVQAPAAQSTTQLLVSSSNSTVISRVYGTDVTASHLLKRKEQETGPGDGKKQRTDQEEEA